MLHTLPAPSDPPTLSASPSSRPRPARRSWYVVGLMAIGIVTARYGLDVLAAAPMFALAALTLIGALVVRGRACVACMGAGVIALSAGWTLVRIGEEPGDALGAMVAQSRAGERVGRDPPLVRVQGVVRTVVTQGPGPRGDLGRFARESSPASAFELDLVGVSPTGDDWARASGSLRVRVDLPEERVRGAVSPGQLLTLTGQLHAVARAMNPGEPEWDLLARQSGASGTLIVPGLELIEHASAQDLSTRATAWWWTLRGKAQARARAALMLDDPALAPTPGRALLGALLLGVRDQALDEVTASFGRLGLLHLVAISGFNMTVMAGVAMLLLRVWGDRGWLEPAGVALCIGVYLLVLPLEAPIARAGVTVLLLLIADACGRRYDPGTLLGWVCAAMLVLRPMDLFGLGFQLSFGIVAVLLVLGSTAHERVFGMRIRGVLTPRLPPGPMSPRTLALVAARRARSSIAQGITAALLAWTVSTPIVLVHTGVFSPLAVLATLIVLPVTVVVLWIGYVLLLVCVLVPGLAEPAQGLVDGLGSVVITLVTRLDALPGASVQLPSLSIALGAAMLVLVLAWWRVGHLRHRGLWLASLVMATWLTAEITLGPRFAARWPLRVDTLSVGDGTCHLVRSRGEAMLVDCGSLSTGVGERLVPGAIRSLGAWRVPTIMLTHAHIDHYAGILDVVEPLGVKRVVTTPQVIESARRDAKGGVAALLAGLAARGVTVTTVSKGDTFALGEATFTVQWPPAERWFKNPNDASLVMHAVVTTAGGERRAVFMGDAAGEALPELLPTTAPAECEAFARAWRADVLELPHHGAFTQPSAELVDLVQPRVVVQSTGPKRAADTRWNSFKTGRAWLLTPMSGAVWTRIESDGAVRCGTFLGR